MATSVANLILNNFVVNRVKNAGDKLDYQMMELFDICLDYTQPWMQVIYSIQHTKLNVR